MKKFLFTSILFTATLGAFAQSISFGVRTGYNFVTQSPDGQDTKYGVKNEGSAGFNAGGVVNVEFGSFTLQPGLFFTTKGEKVPQQQITGTDLYYVVPAGKYTLDYIEVPVNLLYNIKISSFAGIHFGAGVYAGYGLRVTSTVAGQSKSESFSSSNTNSIYKNPDIGANLVAGITLKKRFLIDFSYNKGLSNIGNDSYDIKNKVTSISLGYLFR